MGATVSTTSHVNGATTSLVSSSLKTSLTSTIGSSNAGACPFVPTSTVTSYSSTTAVYPSTYTSTIPVYPNVDTFYYSSVSTVYQSPRNTTVTSTFYKNTTIIVSPAKTTITKPTPSGFTPVLCEASWIDPTVSNTGVLTRTYTDTSYLESTVLSTSTSTGTLITSVSTSVIPTRVTITATVTATTASRSTRNNPTRTIYDACKTNNVVQKVPDGQYIYNVDFLPDITGILTTAIDEFDCCALCQANSTCIGSVYLAKYIYGDLGTNRCELAFRQDRVCDPRYQGGANVTAKVASNEYVQYFISNGPCGQIIYDADLYQETLG